MAYSQQSFTNGQVLTHTQVNKIETNIRDHVHGSDGISNGIGFLIVNSTTDKVLNPSTSYTFLETSRVLKQKGVTIVDSGRFRIDDASGIAVNIVNLKITPHGDGLTLGCQVTGTGLLTHTEQKRTLPNSGETYNLNWVIPVSVTSGDELEIRINTDAGSSTIEGHAGNTYGGNDWTMVLI